jgi:hypothetical protein
MGRLRCLETGRVVRLTSSLQSKAAPHAAKWCCTACEHVYWWLWQACAGDCGRRVATRAWPVQVEGHPHIFAIGDAVAVDDSHLAYLATLHGAQVVKALALLAKKPGASLPKWKRNAGMQLVLLTLNAKNNLALVGKSSVWTTVPAGMLDFKLKGVLKTLGIA